MKYFSLEDVCELLSISSATVRNWVRLDKLKVAYYEKNEPVFERDYILQIRTEVESGDNKALKSRRNKKYVSGNALYNSYISDNSSNIAKLQSLLAQINDNKILLDEFAIALLISNCAYQLISKKYHENNIFASFRDFLTSDYERSYRDRLIRDFITDIDKSVDFVEEKSFLFSVQFDFEENEDLLGLIYMSCKNIGNRKALGSYYTPTDIVKKLISQVTISDDDQVLDPCCGTGNFLLHLPSNLDVRNVYGNDIDELSVKIARINMALKYPDADYEIISGNITQCDFLTEYNRDEFDYIIGNPPWGYDFSEEEKHILRDKYLSAKSKTIESYDVVMEASLGRLRAGGTVSFVLPEAILNVKAHRVIREEILRKTSISYLEYLGNTFDGVQCPSIILQIRKSGNTLSTKGMRVKNGNKEFVIDTKRNVSADYFSFYTDDQEYELLNKLHNADNITYLRGQADFALGIVTGDNKKYISDRKTSENEMILRGSDISKYHINHTDSYIVYRPEKFQQVAPIWMYRAEEKLLYRFISSQLVFAYDDKGTLSLNSCNVMIPRAEDMNIKYVLAILNSRIAQFIYKMQFNSVKVLRSHIENIPIMMADDDVQKKVMEIQEPLIRGISGEEARKQYEELDYYISRLYGLSEREINIIRKAADE